jgi:hypothetical protein
MENNGKYLKGFSCYYPNKASSGAALNFCFSKENECIFIEGTNKQAPLGEKKFDWTNKLILKLALGDISKMLAFLNGKTKEVKLFHQVPESGTTSTLSLIVGDIKYGGYYLSITKKEKDKELRKVGCPLSDGEAQVLRVLFEEVIRIIYEWK